MASFVSLRSEIFDREERKQQYQAHIRGLNAYDRHKKFLKDYASFYGKEDSRNVKLPVKTDRDTLREGYRFIRTEEDDMDPSWEQRLVKRYYDKLFKEYCIADMSQYKTGKIGLRWRAEKEVISGKAVGRPTLSKLHRDRVHRARLYADRDFHTLVSLRRLAKWGFGPQPSDVALAHEITVRKRMATMRGNKGKEVGEGNRPEIDRQVRPTAGEKRKTISKNLDLENLPSRRGKKVKHGSSQVTKPTPSSQQPTRVYEVDSSTPVESTPSKTPPSKTAPSSSQPSQRAPSNIIENEDLAWERFKSAVTDEDINVCYDMSLKDFEHSGVHDLLKGMSKFIAASRQATGLDKTRILLETRIRELKEESKQWAEVAAKTTEEAKGLQTLVEELKANAVEKDARLEDLQRKTDEQSILLSRAKEEAVAEFKASKQYTDALDTNYAAGFEDFRIDAAERFPDVDFSSIMLNLNPATTSSLLGLNSEDANIEDDATTQPQDDPNPDAST